MSLTPHHAKYYAHDLTRRGVGGMDRLSMSLFDAAVDLNLHQIEAALFALQSPLFKALRRQARQAVTLEEQRDIQEKIQRLERQQRRQRQEIFKVEDEIMEKRDQLIGQLEKRLAQRTATEVLLISTGRSCRAGPLESNETRGQDTE